MTTKTRKLYRCDVLPSPMNRAQYLQKRGLKPSQHARYRKYVAAMRGWLESEVGRSLNRLVAEHAPAELVIERPDLRAPELSRRLKRLLSNMGRGFLDAKRKDVEERFGITFRKGIAACFSQVDWAWDKWTRGTAHHRHSTAYWVDILTANEFPHEIPNTLNHLPQKFRSL